MFLQYTHPHSPKLCIGNNKWHHSFSSWGPCLWGWPVSVWWSNYPWKCVWIPNLLQMCLMLSLWPWTYGMTMCPILDLSLRVVVVWLLLLGPLVSCNVLPTWLLPLSPHLPFTTLFCISFMAHLGYCTLTVLPWGVVTPHLKALVWLLTDLALWVSGTYDTVLGQIGCDDYPTASTGQYG